MCPKSKMEKSTSDGERFIWGQRASLKACVSVFHSGFDLLSEKKSGSILSVFYQMCYFYFIERQSAVRFNRLLNHDVARMCRRDFSSIVRLFVEFSSATTGPLFHKISYGMSLQGQRTRNVETTSTQSRYNVMTFRR